MIATNCHMTSPMDQWILLHPGSTVARRHDVAPGSMRSLRPCHCKVVIKTAARLPRLPLERLMQRDQRDQRYQRDQSDQSDQRAAKTEDSGLCCQNFTTHLRFFACGLSPKTLCLRRVSEAHERHGRRTRREGPKQPQNCSRLRYSVRGPNATNAARCSKI